MKRRKTKLSEIKEKLKHEKNEETEVTEEKAAEECCCKEETAEE